MWLAIKNKNYPLSNPISVRSILKIAPKFFSPQAPSYLASSP